MNEEHTKTEAYRLGANAAFVFVDKVNKLFEEFKKDYVYSEPNFDNKHYMDAFVENFLDNVFYD